MQLMYFLHQKAAIQIATHYKSIYPSFHVPLAFLKVTISKAMPAIKINFEFDVQSFNNIVSDLDHSVLKFSLQPFHKHLRGNTTVGSLRSSLFEAIHDANPTISSKCKGVDLHFNDKLLDTDSKMLIDIVHLWNNSTLTITPSKSVLHFVDAFFDYSELYQNKRLLH
eukprot:319106_1